MKCACASACSLETVGGAANACEAVGSCGMCEPNSGALDLSKLVVESGVLMAEAGVPLCKEGAVRELLIRDSAGAGLLFGVVTPLVGLAARSAAALACRSKVTFWTHSLRATPKWSASCRAHPIVRSSQTVAPRAANCSTFCSSESCLSDAWRALSRDLFADPSLWNSSLYSLARI